MVRVQFGCSIKMLQSDWRGEYRSLFKELAHLGIQHRVTCPHTLKQNGVAEKKHRQIVDMGLTLLAQATLPFKFWSYAFTHGVHLVNRLPTPILQKQSPMRQCVFLGVTTNQKGYKCIDPDGRIFVSRHVTFDEELFLFQTKSFLSSGFGLDHSLHHKSRLGGCSTHCQFGTLTIAATQSSPDQPVVPEPTSILEALQSPTWTTATHNEYKALLANHTWDLVPLPEGQRAVGCKWVFKIKRHADGSVAQYKGRLVVKDYLQEVDINNTFLNGDLQEEIYMVQPPRFEQQGTRGQQLADNSMFIHRSGSQLLYVLVYVDGIIVTGTDSHATDRFVKELDVQFSLKDLGRLSYFLGIELNYTSNGLFLNQMKYILDLLTNASMDKSNDSPTPMRTTYRLIATEGTFVEDATLYRSIVGALQYVVITRPDIAFSVSKVCQFMHKPSDLYFKVFKRILRYLKGTLDYGVKFTKSPKLLLEGFSDASWGSNNDDRCSTSGYCVFLRGNPVSWSSRKQQIVSRSTAEVEYRSLAHVTAEMVWIQYLLSKLGVSTKGKALIWCDSSATVAVTGNSVMHSKFKHVELDLFFVREKVTQGVFQVGHVPSHEQVANVLTKPLSAGSFHKFRDWLRIVSHDIEVPDRELSSTGNIRNNRS
ncbi:hypothetical protein CXB51_019512 [Gossypium anomalum]|uniref:Integrase catalytic domain-containing protein n=1 Tax=Gossypium anomalum TaxID=47600 RepID=A0A8J5YW93_9ROSI|nr:hypothetical protein CXB51_019512 [Gossypium anomalum]